MCSGGSGGSRQSLAQIRGAQTSAVRREGTFNYRSGDFKVGSMANLTSNLKIPKGILDAARYQQTMRSNRTFNGQELAPGQLSPVDRMKFGMGNMMSLGQHSVSRGIRNKGRFSVTDTGDIMVKGAGGNYKARFQAQGLQGGQWQIGGAGKQNAIKLKSEEHARAVWKDFGRDFDSDPYRGKYYNTTTKQATLKRVAINDEGSARRSTRNLRGANQTAQSNSRFRSTSASKKRQGLRISGVGAQAGSSRSGVNVPT